MRKQLSPEFSARTTAFGWEFLQQRAKVWNPVTEIIVYKHTERDLGVENGYLNAMWFVKEMENAN